MSDTEPRSLRAGFLGACPYPVPQGSQVFLRDHALAFAEAGHAAHLITYAHGVGEDLSGLPHHRGTAFPFAKQTRSGPGLAKPFLDLALVPTVRRVVREQQLGVIFAHNYEALLVALAARACPVVYHAHNTLEDELPHYFRGARWAAGLGRRLDRAFPRRAHAVAVPHAALRGHLLGCGCDPARVQIVPPPVWIDDFPLMRVGAGIPPVIYAGNLDPYQNLPLLLAAMQILRETLPEARLKILTGSPGDIPGAEVIPNADFGTLRETLGQDGVFAVPRTAWSGYPVKILNAMAAGMPVVACASAAHAVADGETGLVTPDNDPRALAQALHQLLTDATARATLGQGARAQAAAQNDPQATAAALGKLYAVAVAGGASRAENCAPARK